MNKINYINKEKLFKILATTAIVLSTTVLTGCAQIDDWQKTSAIRNSISETEVYNEAGEQSLLSDLYYIKDRESGDVYICNMEYVDTHLNTELTLAFTKYIGMNGHLGIQLGDSGLMLTHKRDRYYAMTDVNTKEIITIVKNSNSISEDYKYKVDRLFVVMADEILNGMPSDYTKDQVKEEIQNYPSSYTIDEIRSMLNIDNQKEY